MSDYNFTGLSSRSFEQMIQAISAKLIGPNIVIFGDGPDGGREATFEGTVPYPSTLNQWSGYGVVQAKFLQRPESTKEQGEWALGQLRSELEAFADPDKDRRKPEYYIFVTNAVLSAVKKTGAKDKAKAVFDQFKSTVPLKDYDIWDYDKLRAFLDNNDEVRKKYAAFITVGDVLAEVMKQIEFDRPDFETTITNFLEKELLTDQFANLEQAGHTTNDRIPIAHVFTDLPTHPAPLIDPPAETLTSLSPGFVSAVIDLAKERLNPSVVVAEDTRLQPRMTGGRIVLIGGPGQGKSTVGQFCCQLFRTTLLKDRPQHLITPPARDVVNTIKSYCSREKIELPSARRFPLRIELSAFASALASKEQPDVTSVLTYLTRFISKRTSLSVSTNDFREWLRTYPWVIILDGLDEVPLSTNRPEVLSAIQDFWIDAAQLDADLLVVATTRPQGYNEDFSPRYYEHLWLAPLSNARALHYGSSLAHARYGNEPERCNRIIERLTRASQQPATARLMRSPLQVTIMATLVERMGTPPQERWQLFRSYYEIIFMREMERDIPAAAILRDYRSDIDAIHNWVGLLLQIESERTGATEAQLAADQFAAVVRARLESEGHEKIELEELKEKIIDAATNRLVFLVGLQENKIGFEIRSLQEFMASEALMDGKDETIRARLRTIAVIANWRNVFLFAAGKCFAVQQALRDTVVAIAAELNENAEDRMCVATLAGSQLCLDLLSDGSSRRQPKYGRILLRIALRVLQLPPSEHQRRLAALYDEQFEEIYRDEIVKALDSSIPEHRLGAWVCLLNLIESGIQWAESIGDKYWPTTKNVEELLKILPFIGLADSSSWFSTKIVGNLPEITPKALYKVLSDADLSLNNVTQFDNKWLQAIVALRLTTNQNEISIRDDSYTFSLPRTITASPIRFFNTPVRGNYLPTVEALLDIPSPRKEWSPLIESARFLKNPSAASLAETLRAIATNINFRTDIPALLNIPWPIGACLGICKTPKEICVVAGRAENGEFGELRDWEQAEHRWQTQGLTLPDFEHMTNERIPISKSIATIGFPFSDFSLSMSVASTETLRTDVVGLLEIYKKISGFRARSVVAHALLFAMSVLQRAKNETIELSAAEFKQLVVETVGGGNRVWASAIGAIRLDEPIDSEWTETLDFTGQQKTLSARPINSSTRAVIHKTFLCNPHQKGLMRLLALTTYSAELPSIPVEMISPDQFDELEDRKAATMLTIKQDLSQVSSLAGLVKSTAALLNDHPDLNIAQLRVSGREVATAAENDFWFVLLDQLPASAWNHRHDLINRFQESLAQRTSKLDRPHIWESLQLPIGLRNFFEDQSST